MKDLYLELHKMTAMMIVSDEYLTHLLPQLSEVFTNELKKKLNYYSLNRQQTNRANDKIKKEIKEFKTSGLSLSKKLKKFTEEFSEDETFYHIYDDVLDTFDVAMSILYDNGKIDPIKKKLLYAIKKIQNKERSESETIRLEAVIDNFLTLNKLK